MAKTKKKIGRPLIKVDKETFEKLCGLHCTLIEISGFMGCSDETIERWCKREYGKPFAEVNKLKRGKGAVSLRRKQFEVAMNGNPTLLIWLGKQYLDQSDKNELNANISHAHTVTDLIKGTRTEQLALEAQARDVTPEGDDDPSE